MSLTTGCRPLALDPGRFLLARGSARFDVLLARFDDRKQGKVYG